jgi:hypothetical protein
MAKIALAVAAAAAGVAISVATGGLGAFAVGAWIPDIIAGASVGLAVGGAIGQIAFPNRQKLQMPLQDLQVSSSANGAAIPFGYSNNRYAGQVIWAPDITFINQKEPTPGASGGGGGSFIYTYFGSFAVSFGEGPGTIHRIWGDSKIIYAAPGATAGNFIPLGEVPVWDPTVTYNTDDIVEFVGAFGDANYQAILPSTNIPPEGNSLYWELTSEYPPWDSSVTYQPGATVDYWGQIYAATIPNVNHSPAGSDHWAPLADYYVPPTIYPGTQTQLPDPTIQAAEGVDITPAFRPLVYAVWENFPLANFGNRLPNFRAEVTFPDPIV